MFLGDNVMILYSFQCSECNEISEHFFDIAICPRKIECPVCQGIAFKIISIPGPNIASGSPDWIKSIKGVVNKEGGRHCQEFLRDPTRVNYQRWMKVEGVRHMEHGEKHGRPDPTPSTHVITEKLMQKRMENRKLEAHLPTI